MNGRQAQVKAFRLLVNSSVEWAEWDNQMLAVEFQEIQGFDIDLNLTGFEQRDWIGRGNAKKNSSAATNAEGP